ncbi:hypothetical protein RDI58_010642 [Solanum bulbocastanum]|uniref:Uncharacterized protein n=1 Tax=Solanum bulbocastanum TaxID=147425 RepID=A0AAN8YGY7_SOLBU
MQWHHEERNKDGVLRHPIDFEAWKSFHSKYLEFSGDPHNVCLGLAFDGFNPFGTMRTVHSTWPVILMPYNLPPWMCMKEEFFILSLLIPGPKSPGNNIDQSSKTRRVNYLKKKFEKHCPLWRNSFPQDSLLIWYIWLLTWQLRLNLPVQYIIAGCTQLRGSIAEAYIANEWLAFCSRYLEGGDSKSYCSRRCNDEIEHETSKDGCLFPTIGEPYGGVDVNEIDEKTLLQAHRHVHFNCEEYIAEIKRSHCKRCLTQHQFDRMHFDTFSECYKEQAKELEVTSDILKNIKVLAKGPSYIAKRFSAYDLFTEQAQQAIFVQDPQDHEWFVPRLIRPRDVFDMGEENSVQLESSIQSDSTDLGILENSHVSEIENNDWVRSGVDGIVIDMEVHTQASPNNGEANLEGRNDIENESNLEARKVRGPTLLKDIWKLPPGKTVDVPFNSRNQAIGKEGRKLSSFLGIIAGTPELTPLHTKSYTRDQWSGLVSYWLSDKAKRCTQASRNNRTKQKMPHTGGSKSIATLMNEQTANGREPTLAEIFLLTHKQRVDGRPLDDDSAKAIEMINEKMSNSEGSIDQPPHHIACKGDVYSQVLGNERSGYVRGLGLGPTPSILWGSRSFLENIDEEDSSNEIVQRLEQEITELKAKQNDEMNMIKQNQDNMQLELLQMRKFMCKHAPNESMPQNINGTSSGQITCFHKF